MTTQDREYDAVNSFALFSPPYPGERRETLRFRKESGTDYAVVLHPQESEGVVEVTDESLGGDWRTGPGQRGGDCGGRSGHLPGGRSD